MSTYTLTTVAGFLAKISRNSSKIYRGQAHDSWRVISSIGRHYNDDWNAVSNYERSALEKFKKHSKPHLPYLPGADIEMLALMQHHGCITRLIDFTTNPLIALFFASAPTNDDADGIVFEADYKDESESISDDELFIRSDNFAYFPPHIASRIIGQSGCFVYCGNPSTALSTSDFKSFIIKSADKHAIRSQLAKLSISNATLFPGLDGICQDLSERLRFNLLLETLM